LQPIDLPVHGNNPEQTIFRIESFADTLIRHLEKEGEKASVFGYSMGGYVALYAAYKRPDLFEGVMTLATKFHWNEAIADREKAMLNPDEMLKKIPAFVEQLTQRHPHIEWRELLAQTSMMIDALGQAPLLTNEIFGQLHVPVLIGVGDKDQMVSMDETIDTFRKIPNAQCYVLPNTKHPFERVDPILLSQHMVRFFTSAEKKHPH
jgi:pimeloyl-ACP methyl ester carboxylesterase